MHHNGSVRDIDDVTTSPGGVGDHRRRDHGGGLTRLRRLLSIEPSGRLRVALTFADQGVSSGSNFLSGLVVIGALANDQFGTYMVAFTWWLASVGLARAAITEPLMLGGSTTGHGEVRRGFGADVLLGAVLASIGGLLSVVAFGFGNSGLGRALATVSVMLIPAMVQDYWRAVGFHFRTPQASLVNDVLFTVVQLAILTALLVTDSATVPGALTAWGIGGLVGACFGYWLYGGSVVGSWSVLRDLWRQGRWLTSDFVAQYGADQLWMLVLYALVAEADYGGVRSAIYLMGPVMVIMIAGGNIGLPEATRRFERDGTAGLVSIGRWLSIGVGGLVTLYGVVVFFAAEPIMRLLDVDNAAEYVGVARLAAVQFIITAAVFGLGVAVKVTGRSRRLWKARVITAVVTSASVVVFEHWFGLIGAGWTAMVSGLCFAASVVWAWRSGPVRIVTSNDVGGV
jgi:O-antigen/teichoic acid export membrane protein